MTIKESFQILNGDKMKYLKSTSWLLLLLCLLILGCKNDNNKTIKAKIGIIKVQSGLPTFVAYEAGFFKNSGLDIELIPFKSSDLAFNALDNGEIDIVGVSGIAQALQLNDIKPNKFKIIGILNSSPFILVKNDSGIKSLDSLSSKTIGVFPGSVFGSYAKLALETSNVDCDDITFLPLKPPLQISSLDNGNVDALFSLEPVGRVGSATGKYQYLIDYNIFSKELLGGNSFPGGVTAISTNFINKNKDAIPKIISAYQESMKIINHDGFNELPYLNKYTSIETSLLKSTKYDGAAFGSNINTEQLKKYTEVINKLNLLKEDLNIESIIYKEN